jgi:hypothetical protein
MTFESGMVLVGNVAALEDKVDLPASQTGANPAPVVLRDTIASLTGR